MMFKTEMHCHTAEVSPCAGFTASKVVETYVEAGFSTLVITDHFRNYVLDNAGATWRQQIDHYLAGYRKAQACANGRIHVLLGIELQFVGEHNDYLVYGIDEDFLYENSNLHRMTLKQFRALLPQNAMIVHAHAFRSGMTVENPELLNGIETYNGGTADPNNEFANLWAERFDLIKTSGSDYHGGPVSRINGGIITNEPITNSDQLVQALCKKSHSLIKKGIAES